MRAVLVIEEMPTECIECQFCRILADDKPKETRCILNAKRNEDGVNTRAEWCPLRPMPKPITEYEVKVSYDYDSDYAEGWNDCLKELEK